MLRWPALRVVLTALVLLCVATGASDALAAKKKKGGDPVADAFGEQYKSDDAKVRGEAVLSLKSAPDATKLALLAKHVVNREPRADVISRAVTVLSSIKDEQVVADVVAKSRQGKVDARVVYLESMAGLKGEPPHTALLAALGDGEPRVRGMAAWALGQHRVMDALEPLLKLLDDRHWQVQSAAIASLYRLPDKEPLRTIAAPKLVEFLEESSGRMREDAAHALGRIMGRNLGKDVGKWRRLLAGEDVSTRDEGEEVAVKTGRYEDEVSRPHFYGMEVTSNRIVIVLDMSLSMNDPIEIDRDRLRRETSQRKAAVTGDGSDNDAEKNEDEDRRYDIPWWRIKSRLDMAREQTILLVSQLREEQHFDIIYFSNDMDPWMGRLVPATSANKQKAIARLKSVKPDDKTNTWGALATAFDLMGNQKKSYAEGPDEIYLVTDGAPSIGDITDPEQILEAILQLHRVKPIRINVIGIGVNLRFLRNMARETGGTGKFFTK